MTKELNNVRGNVQDEKVECRDVTTLPHTTLSFTLFFIYIF